MTVDIEQVKRKNPIQDVMTETGARLVGTGRYRRLDGDHSLVVDTEWGCYYQNGGGDEGWGQDVIEWVKYRERCTFQEAVEWLCRRARMPPPDWGSDQGKARQSARLREDAFTVAARVFARRLYACPDALQYAQEARGWTDETLRKACIGYSGSGSPQERQGLIDDFKAGGVDPESPAAVAVVGYTGDVAEWGRRWSVKPQMDWLERNYIPGFPGRMLIYPHMRGGRVHYLSGRLATTESKAELREKGVRVHHNLSEALAGERQRYYNHAYSPRAELLVVQEGQADAVTLGQWAIAAVGLVGNAVDEALVQELKGLHKRIAVWLDNEPAMWAKSLKVAGMFGPTTRLVRMPA